jgi:dienelactone hydrolase
LLASTLTALAASEQSAAPQVPSTAKDGAQSASHDVQPAAQPPTPDAKPTPPSTAPEVPNEIIPTKWLVIAPVDKTGRRPFRPDAVFARHLLARDAAPPTKDEKLTGELGTEQSWQEREAKPDGSLDGEIGYAYTSIDSPIERVMLAQLSGAGRLFVNGAGFTGDLYAYGFGGVPIALAKGHNDLFVTGVRGTMRLKLTTPSDRVVFGAWDATVPDVIAGDRTTPTLHLSVLVENATTSRLLCKIVAGSQESPFHQSARVASLSSLCVSKVAIELRPSGPMPESPGKLAVPLEFAFGPADESFSTADVRIKTSIDLEVRAPNAARRCTFVSFVDDSVQQCAILPPSGQRDNLPPDVVLTLHGAGVDALGQVSSYSPKKEFVFIAPTNRRPFGFDWQDWGRLNAFEALESGLSWISPRSDKIYLTGHSMGGHGTWHLAANYPDRFVAIAPSAGWASFDTYGGRPDGELKSMWHAADGSSDTMALVSNLKSVPTFILHGTADDNVPVSEAHAMEKALIAAGAKPSSHYQEGAGHWWDGDAAPGADCVDWPGIFDFFRAARIVNDPVEIDFTTFDPSVSAKDHWLELLQATRYGERMHAHASFDKETHKLVVATENVHRFRLTDAFSWQPRACEIDGRAIECSLPACFVRAGDEWKQDRARSSFSDEFWTDAKFGLGLREKTPGCSGPFKSAFDHHFTLVFGTHGTASENRELFERARSDAETWWYRANGSPPLMSDDDLRRGAPTLDKVRSNVILYGNADTNSAWSWLLGTDGPIQAKRGSLKLGDREWKGDNLGAVFVRPSRIEESPGKFGGCIVGAFADTGVAGTRLGYTLAPFVSGVGYPDYVLFSADVLSKGDGGVLAAGWFDCAWKLDGHEYMRPETK